MCLGFSLICLAGGLVLWFSLLLILFVMIWLLIVYLLVSSWCAPGDAACLIRFGLIWLMGLRLVVCVFRRWACCSCAKPVCFVVD